MKTLKSEVQAIIEATLKGVTLQDRQYMIAGLNGLDWDVIQEQDMVESLIETVTEMETTDSLESFNAQLIDLRDFFLSIFENVNEIIADEINEQTSEKVDAEMIEQARTNINQCGIDIANRVFTIGANLNKVRPCFKNQVLFLAWTKENFNYGKSTTFKYMKIESELKDIKTVQNKHVAFNVLDALSRLKSK